MYDLEDKFNLALVGGFALVLLMIALGLGRLVFFEDWKSPVCVPAERSTSK